MSALIIRDSGTIEFIWDDALAFMLEAGEATIARASHVEPVGTQWEADMSPSGGPVLSGFAMRGDAIAAEIEWLENNRGM
jgi:hypothetical protein